MRATYTGHLSVTYMNYTDLATGKTLQVEPGGTYDIAPDVPPADFIPVQVILDDAGIADNPLDLSEEYGDAALLDPDFPEQGESDPESTSGE